MQIQSCFPMQYRVICAHEWIREYSVKAYLQVNQDTLHSGKSYHNMHEMIMCIKTYFVYFFKYN